MIRWIPIAVMLTWPLAGRALADQWTSPAGDLLTEQQLQVYFDTTRDWLSENAKMSDALAQAQTPQAKLAVVSDVAQQYRACLSRHHLTESEFNWIDRRATGAWDLAAYVRDEYSKAQAELASQMNANEQQMRQAEATKARYELALKQGRRMISTQDRQAAIVTAESDEQSALTESRQADEEAQDAADEAVQDAADAKAAFDQANNPPDDLAPEELADYVQQKKGEAQAALRFAAEARRRQDIAEQASAVALWQADDAAQTAAHPDIPVTDEDKAALKAQNQAAIARADAEIAGCNHASQQMTAMKLKMEKSVREMENRVPAQNVELMTQHFDDYQNLFTQ